MRITDCAATVIRAIMRVVAGKVRKPLLKQAFPSRKYIFVHVYVFVSLGQRGILFMLKQTHERSVETTRHEREFMVLERERLKTEQITEASERLNGAMENVFEYTYRDNDFYFQGQALRPIFERGIVATEEIVKTMPQFSVELLRRHIELKQLNEQVALAKNVDWQNPLVLVHLSPTPDAVLNDGIDLNAYDKDRKKIMVRITEPMVDGVKVTSMSLDGNDRIALQAVGDFFGVSIPDDASSEDILAMSFLAEKSQFDGERPAKVLRKRYDQAMKMQHGGEWYAGRRDSEVITTLQKILRYPDLVEAHVDEVWSLKKKLGRNFRFSDEYEQATYNFLAAIGQSYDVGASVGDLAIAGEAARQQGVEFGKSDCPTADIKTAEQALELQGIGQNEQWHYGICRVCLGAGQVGACEVCYSCEAADNRGISLDLIHARALRRIAAEKRAKEPGLTGEQVHKAKESAGQATKTVKRIFGEFAILKSRITLCDSVTDVVDSTTGEVIVASVSKNDFVLTS